MRKIARYKSGTNTIWRYVIAFAAGILIGFRTLPEFVAVPYVLLSIACLYFASQNDVEKVLCILCYLIYTEIFVRAYVLIIPYLYIQYLMIGLMGILIIKGNKTVKIHSRSFVFMLLFALIEYVDSGRATNADVARFLVVNTSLLAVITAWGSFNFLTPETVNRILNHIKYAGIFLCGIILARYLGGDIEFQARSSSETTNGLAPVQIRGYLGFSCSIFFLSVVNDTERKDIILNIILLVITSIVMLLSFSRGGIYFLGVIMALYFLFNGKKARSYLMFLLLIPVGLFVYYYVTERTNGLIEQRYNQEGTSGRDLLVQAAWVIFSQNPVTGVGTGNFNSAVIQNKLFYTATGAHNEFMRVAAEHGVLGIIMYWGFFIFLFFELLARGKIEREYGIYFLALFCMIVVHNALKISLQPLILLLAVATPTVKLFKRKTHAPAEKNFVVGY